MNKYILQFILLLVFLFTACSSKTEYLPQNIFDITLEKKLTDHEAEQFVNRLHFGNVAASQNEIAFYSGQKGKAIIYVSYYESEEESEVNLDLMVKKISPQNSVFSGGESFEMNDVKVYRYSGMGQTHFVFSHRKALLWLSAEVNWAEKFLKEYLNEIN